MKEIIFVTGNPGKRALAQQHFDEDFILLKCYEYELDEPKLNDIEFIAKSKVLQAYKKVKQPCIALDAGFYIKNYPNNSNFPGAFPKRDLLESIGINGLLENMKDVDDRYCCFKECLAYYDGEEIKYFYGINEGTLSRKILGNDTDKKWSELWYVFIPKNCNKTLMEMSDEERLNRKDGHTDPFIEFKRWYQDIPVLKNRR